MRLLHTSDWHLGHALHGVGREREHAAFLAWLLTTIVAERVDAVLITGDIFDGSVPPAAAEAMWFGFLAEAVARRPGGGGGGAAHHRDRRQPRLAGPAGGAGAAAGRAGRHGDRVDAARSRGRDHRARRRDHRRRAVPAAVRPARGRGSGRGGPDDLYARAGGRARAPRRAADRPDRPPVHRRRVTVGAQRAPHRLGRRGGDRRRPVPGRCRVRRARPPAPRAAGRARARALRRLADPAGDGRGGVPPPGDAGRAGRRRAGGAAAAVHPAHDGADPHPAPRGLAARPGAGRDRGAAATHRRAGHPAAARGRDRPARARSRGCATRSRPRSPIARCGW